MIYSKQLFWALNLLIILLPTYLIRFSLGFLKTNFFEVFFFFILIWWVFETIFKKSLLKFNCFLTKNLLFSGGLILLLIGVSLSTIFSLNPLVSLGILKSWFFVPVIFFLIISNVKNKKSLVFFLRSLSFSGIIVSIISFFYLVLGRLTYDNRLSAFFENPNQLAMYLVPAWLVSLFFFCFSKKRIEKRLWLSFLSLISIPLFFSYSYGAWFGVLFGSSICLILIKTKFLKLKKIKFFWFLTTLVLLIIVFSSAKFQGLLLDQRSSFHSRLIIWRSALYIIKDHWLVGIGPGSFQQAYLEYQEYFPPYLEWAVPQPHNLFLAFWLQAGLLGFMGFISILVWFFKKTIICFKNNQKIAILLLAIMSYFLIHGMIDTTYWRNDLSVVFWLIIGLMSIISHQDCLQRKENLLGQKR